MAHLHSSFALPLLHFSTLLLYLFLSPGKKNDTSVENRGAGHLSFMTLSMATIFLCSVRFQCSTRKANALWISVGMENIRGPQLSAEEDEQDGNAELSSADRYYKGDIYSTSMCVPRLIAQAIWSLKIPNTQQQSLTLYRLYIVPAFVKKSRT